MVLSNATYKKANNGNNHISKKDNNRKVLVVLGQVMFAKLCIHILFINSINRIGH